MGNDWFRAVVLIRSKKVGVGVPKNSNLNVLIWRRLLFIYIVFRGAQGGFAKEEEWESREYWSC